MRSEDAATPFVPEVDADQSGTVIRGEERDEGVGELSPLPDDAGGDAPPERDALADLEAATGHNLNDDLTAEATRLTGSDEPETGFGAR